MKAHILGQLLLQLSFLSIGFGQEYCQPGRFDQQDYFSTNEISVETNVYYGSNFNQFGIYSHLYMDIYYPSLGYDDLEYRPLIVFLPGGGFQTAEKEYFTTEAMAFAKKGFVCATIDYRSGWASNGTNANCNGDSISLIKATYRANQDFRAAVRFLLHEYGHYGIDTNYVFALGSSAGGITGYMGHFMNQGDYESYYPTLGLPFQLGELDNATNSYNAKFNLKAYVGLWGAIPSTSFITEANTIPMIMFHGGADHIVPFNSGPMYGCNKYYQLHGSAIIAKKLREYDECFELNFQTGGGHHVYNLDYRIIRITDFIRSVLCEECEQNVIVDKIIKDVSAIDQLESFEFFADVQSLDYELNIYPNPTIDYVHLESTFTGKSKYALFDLRGNLISMDYFDSYEHIDLTFLNQGTYLIQFFNEEGIIYAQEKIVKVD